MGENVRLRKAVTEVFPPFLMAGSGMVLAGALLNTVKDWEVYLQAPELFIMVPALLGLKGNLEMTLASRLSTMAHLGQMSDPEASRALFVANLAMTQVQAIVVGTLASVFAMAMAWIPTPSLFTLEKVLLLSGTSVATASAASFVLGLVMILVIQTANNLNINPDNVATPIAASLGDLATLAILSGVASVFHSSLWISMLVLLVLFSVVSPLCWKITEGSSETKKALDEGWVPVLTAMGISSLGGKILNVALTLYPDIASLQPVVNGVAGNLVAVQASRLSTQLHSGRSDDSSASKTSDISGLLLAVVVPGHALFLALLNMIEPNEGLFEYQFALMYFASAIIQVAILLYLAKHLVAWLWNKNIDPDVAAIPYLTSLGDLIGGLLLAATFHFDQMLT